MRALDFVGRVGGLAVALGVGAAALNYSAVAWADAPSGASEATSTGSEASSAGPSATSRRSHGGASPATAGRPGYKPPASHSRANPPSPAAAARPRVTIPTTPVQPATDTVPATLTGIAAGNAAPTAAPTTPQERFDPPSPAPAAISPLRSIAPAPAPQAAPVPGLVTAAADPAADPFANGNPTAPVGSPLEWALAAYARRELAAPSTTAAVPVVPAAAATQPLILGPSGVPIPSTRYVDTVMEYYVLPNSPEGAETPQVVFTPEGLYPITGVKSLPLNTSVDQGMKILSDTLGELPAGTTTTVFGYSQSAIIGSLMEAGYISPTSPYNNDPAPPAIPDDLKDSISFIYVGNELNPNGGFLSRFPGLNLPSLGIPFYGPTPEDAYPTTNYAREYDGFADFPRYPLNLVSVVNALLGIAFVHTEYTPGPTCRSFCLTKQEVEEAIALPTTSPTQNYYFMPTENLPLLQPLRFIPFIGNPLANLIQPVLKVIVDLGYGDPAHGFASGTQPDANVLVPFGLFPQVSPLEVLEKLVAGVQQGINDFIADFGPGGSVAREVAAISLPTLSFALPTPTSLIAAVQDIVLGVAEQISGSIASLYAALLPTADIVNAVVAVLPAYAVTVFLDGIQQMIDGDVIGGLINAIGLPIAAAEGLATTAGFVGILSWLQAAVGVVITPDIR